MGMIQTTQKGVYGIFSTLRSLSTTLPYLVHGKAAQFQKEVTEQYPDPISSRSKDDLPAKAKGSLVNDISKCSGCGECEKICPTQCIKVESVSLKDLGREWVARFDIDLASCIFCGLCTEVCEPQSLTMSKDFENAKLGRDELVIQFGRGEVSDEKRAILAIGKRERRSW